MVAKIKAETMGEESGEMAAAVGKSGAAGEAVEGVAKGVAKLKEI